MPKRGCGNDLSFFHSPFEDVSPDMYYYDAVLWACNIGITKGTSATTFDSEEDCLRAQVVTFLYRAYREN